jgi:hypothetical protein
MLDSLWGSFMRSWEGLVLLHQGMASKQQGSSPNHQQADGFLVLQQATWLWQGFHLGLQL